MSQAKAGAIISQAIGVAGHNLREEYEKKMAVVQETVDRHNAINQEKSILSEAMGGKTIGKSKVTQFETKQEQLDFFNEECEGMCGN